MTTTQISLMQIIPMFSFIMLTSSNPPQHEDFERYKINDAINWTYSYEIHRDEFDDRITSVNHYVSISNFNAQWYEAGNSNLKF